MKKLVLFISILIIIQAESLSQSCLPNGINFNTQSEIDNFQTNYPNCSEIEGDVRICGVDITDLSGLSVLESIEGDLMIGYWENIGNAYLTSLSGLENLNYIGGTLSIKYNDALLDLSGLFGLNQIGGSLSIVRVPLITNFSGLNNLTSIGGQLYIFENYSLETFIGLENLTSIDGDITIDGNNSLASIEGMVNLSDSSINSLSIYGNSSLTNCSVESICNYLSSPNGVVKIRNNAIGCNSPPEIAEGCGITLPCLPYGDYVFTSQAQIDSFQTNYPECTELYGNTLIDGDDITNLIGFNVVTHFGNDLKINSNPLLGTLNGLNEVDSIGGSLFIYNNPFIRHLTALQKLNYVGYDLYIGYNEHLMNLTGLDSLASIGHNFWIVHNPELIDITGLTRLGSMGGYFHITGNLILPSLDGLDNLDANTINGLQIRNNDSLSECEVKTICEYISNPNNTTSIYGNTVGCNSKQEVIEACLVDNPENSPLTNYISLYPNPAMSQIIIHNTENYQNIRIVIYNLFGQSVLKLNSINEPINIEALDKGIYLVEIVTNEKKTRKKLIKR